jgi:hypothetical protein
LHRGQRHRLRRIKRRRRSGQKTVPPVAGISGRSTTPPGASPSRPSAPDASTNVPTQLRKKTQPPRPSVP